MATQVIPEPSLKPLQIANQEAKQATKEAIEEALILLMEEKPLENISISELTKKAGVSRNAFYRHYQTKEVLFHKMIKRATLKVVKGLQRFNFQTERYQAWLYLFKQAKKNARLLKIILKYNMLQWIYDIIINRLSKFRKLNDSKQNQYRHSFWSQAVLSVLGRWINEGMVVPEEEMAAMDLPLLV
ncbi:TetR/AcrR family transcriptional regulator [Streptococcus halotolerans]|uniref:TetR/AcrR family transcriptional regulator n=1 Tax=Streptococcus halotolerans TaxID=1814128 RepID=UPI000788E618|nr:TetR/AcrR family transcriptional regulator [Streptococcus halotolerans]